MATAGDSRYCKDRHDRRRYNPYVPQYRRDDGRFDGERRGGVSVGGGGGTAAGGGGYRMGGGGRGPGKKWFKITILHGKKYAKKWLLPALQNLCSVPFTPIRYRVEGNKAQFLVDDATTANALVKVSRKITDSDGFRVILLSNPCNPPASILNYLKPEDLDHIKQCMSKRFDGSQQALDLSSIRRDRQLISQNIKMILNWNSCMQAVIKIIEESIPELICLNLSNNRLYQLEDLADLVGKAPKLKTLNLSDNELKSEQELDRVKGFKLTELWLTGNPLCDHFKDRAAYISAIQKRFPRLLKLDGFDLPAPIGFDLESNSTTLPPCKGSYFASDEIKTLISRFLQQYYMVYDSGDRQPLLDGYHDGAVFSLSIAFSGQNPSRSSLGDYYKDNRNIKSLKDPTTRFRLLKHRRLNVVTFLNELPKTQHDTASFNVDVNMFTNTLLSFTVSGVFKEVDGKSRDSVRAFSRVFITVPAANAGLCVVNDELTLRNATTEEIRRAFAAPAPTPSSIPVPTLTAPQQEMLAAFSQKSGMNPEWSQKCLQDNAWDFNRAAHIFSQLKAAGKIPEMAFLK